MTGLGPSPDGLVLGTDGRKLPFGSRPSSGQYQNLKLSKAAATFWNCRPSANQSPDLPLVCHPAAIRASAGFARDCAFSDETGGVSRRWDVSDRRVRPTEVVVGNPHGDLCSGIVELEEQALVEQFIAHAAVEALDRSRSASACPVR